MREREGQVFREPGAAKPIAEKKIARGPFSQDIVHTVSAEFSMETGLLGRAVHESLDTSHIDIGTLLMTSDPLPVSGSQRGAIYVIANRQAAWDSAGAHLGLTGEGRDAVAATHNLQVKTDVPSTEEKALSGFVVPCSGFPDAAVEQIARASEGTRLTNRQATVWVLSEYLEDPVSVASVLSLPQSVVTSEMVAVERITRESQRENEILDGPGELSHQALDPQSTSWMGLDWSSWLNLRNREDLTQKLSRRSGLYKVRHCSLPGLMYIGETGSDGGIRQRVALELSSGVINLGDHDSERHTAARPLRQLLDELGGELEVSITTPPVAAAQRHRRAIEAALLAICRREIGWTPMVQHGRNPMSKVVFQTEDRHRELSKIAERASHDVPKWRPWRDVTSDQWLGIGWSESRELADRGGINNNELYAYRIWQSQNGSGLRPVLKEIGTSGAISSRLFRLHREYGDRTLYSVATLENLSTDSVHQSREIADVRSDLVGAHYLATGSPSI